jgi:hypothetical protein
MVGGEDMSINYPETEEKFCKYLSGKHQLEMFYQPKCGLALTWS